MLVWVRFLLVKEFWLMQRQYIYTFYWGITYSEDHTDFRLSASWILTNWTPACVQDCLCPVCETELRSRNHDTSSAKPSSPSFSRNLPSLRVTTIWGSALMGNKNIGFGVGKLRFESLFLKAGMILNRLLNI